MKIETEIRAKGYGRKAEGIMLHHRKYLNPQADMAMAFIERWGVVAAKPDGEDAAGRQKLALLTIDEVVDRAFEMADKAFDRAEALGWVIPTPSLDELDEESLRDSNR